MPKGLKGFQKGHKINNNKKFTKEHRINLSESHKGHKPTREHRRIMSIAQIGRKHEPTSEETRKKLSLSHVGKKQSPETIAKRIKSKKAYYQKYPEKILKGKNHPSFGKKPYEMTDIIRKRQSESHKGNPGYWKGKKRTEVTKLKISTALKGEKSNLWKGGISYEPYSINWTETLKISIRERDKYTCKLCSQKQGEITHCVHHIDYNKKNDSSMNLITLCRNCHTKTNCNRTYWTIFFTELMIRLYGLR